MVVVRRLAGAAVTSIKGGPDQDGLRSRVGPIKTDFDQAWALSRQASIKREPNRTGPDQAWARPGRRLAQAWEIGRASCRERGLVAVDAGRSGTRAATDGSWPATTRTEASRVVSA